MRVIEVERPAGGVLRAYDTGPTGRADELAVLWHGGTPNTGRPPTPLLADAAALGLRLLGADRPGYGGTTRDPDASIADVVPDALAVADALGVERFGVLGHSGGGPRVLACAALAADRVVAAVAVSSPAPPDAAATSGGPDAQADDLLAAARPWGFDVGAVRSPVLVVHGDQDRMVPAAHGAWLADRLPRGDLRLVPGAGHISVLDGVADLLRELRRRAG